MGPNWELISDAINSTLHLKVSIIVSLLENLCIFIVCCEDDLCAFEDSLKPLFALIFPFDVFVFVIYFSGVALVDSVPWQCIFRKPQECKERHKILMDMNSGDGADSAEDSGSSQPYPSTIPGIPKARVCSLKYKVTSYWFLFSMLDLRLSV